MCPLTGSGRHPTVWGLRLSVDGTPHELKSLTFRLFIQAVERARDPAQPLEPRFRRSSVE